MKIENSFVVPRPLPDAWRTLLDIPNVVPCIPGVELREAVSEREFRVLGTVRLGPVQLRMDGEVEILHADEAAGVLRLRGKAHDSKGRGSALAAVTLVLTAADAERTDARVTTDLDLVGTIAQYGRGAGLIQAVATQLVQQFASNLESRLAAERAAPPDTSVSMPAVPSPAEPGPRPLSLWHLLLQMLRAALSRR